MYSRPPDNNHQLPPLRAAVLNLDGAAQALAWLHLVEEQRYPVLAAAACHLTNYAHAALQAAEAGDTDALDEVVALRLGTITALLLIVRAHWEHGVRGMATWTADALAEIAHWVEQAREEIIQALGE